MAGSNPFGPKSVPGTTQAELNARGTVKGPIWGAQRMPWVDLQGFASSCGGGSPLSSKLNTAPSSRYESGLTRTKPVITQVQVKKQGELGTTRACTVNLTAFTDNQLVDLQKCFFIPGMTVRVQWGWSVSCTGTAAPQPISGAMPDPTAICMMRSKAASNPAYDGLQGLVTNFSYKLNNDGYWDCSLELVAAAESVGDGKVAVYGDCGDGCTRTFKTTNAGGDEVETTAKRSLLYTYLFDINTVAMNGDDPSGLASKVSWATENSCIVSTGAYEGEDRNENGGSEQSFMSAGNYDAREGYISFSTLEAAINTYAIPTTNKVHNIGKCMSTSLKVPSNAFLESGDPRICVIPGSPQIQAAIGAGNFVWEMGAPGGVWSGGEFDFGGIMLNCIFLMQELKSVEDGDNKIKTFLQNVIRKVSNTCGGFWNDILEVVSTTENCEDKALVPIISIVDLRKYNPGAAYSIPTQANNSVIRDLKLDMKLTGAMKSQALYANGAKQSGKSAKCDGVPFRAFGLGPDGSVKDACRPSSTTDVPCDCESPPPGVEAEPKSFADIFEEMYDVVENGTTQATIAAVADKVNKDNDTLEKCKGMILPFDFGFTVDGVGGFAFGQIITSDRIPSSVSSNFDFQITSVEHSISIQDWTTTVSTVARFKNAG